MNFSFKKHSLPKVLWVHLLQMKKKEENWISISWITSPIGGYQATQRMMRVQPGACNLSSKNKTSVVLSWVERAHLSTRCIQRTNHPVIAVIQSKWRDENPFTHFEYSWSVSLYRWLLYLKEQNRDRLCINSLQSLSVTAFTPLLVPHALMNTQ